MTRRAVPEWIGKTLDTPIPPRVKVRVFEQFGGICYLTGIKINAGDKWDCDHVKALINGGENRESNLAPALSWAHKLKTKEDVADKAKVARIKAKHLGVKGPKQKIKSRGFRQYPTNTKDINTL